MFPMVEIQAMIMLPVFPIAQSLIKAALGFMRTAETYNGDNGYSMRLDGMENGFNNNARPRAIVMHGSDYVSAHALSTAP